jgi:two-component system response regulator AtoC
LKAARLAIVDDDPAFIKYVTTLLTSSGYEVSTFKRGEELLRALAAGQPPDVVLLDVLMPGMDGLETLRAVRSSHPDIQVIMLSGNTAPSTIVNAVRLGAVDYVLKPDDPHGVGEAALEATIRSAIEKVSLTREVARLRAQIAEGPDGVQACWATEGSPMRPVLMMVERVASSDVSVLISGESGVGKEVIARELHRQSGRRGHNFVKVSCAALPADLLESELFGHERGAFTGASSARMGKFEFANGGTILLDEIGELPGPLQAKLLHVLQDRTFTRIGSNHPVSVDVRVIAATNRDLSQMIRTGEFREDLYYRLQVIEIRVPTLRERRDEIVPLIEFFLTKYSARYGRRVTRPSPGLLARLESYGWPGNVRELENVIKRYVILEDEQMVLNELARTQPAQPPRLRPVYVEPQDPGSLPYPAGLEEGASDGVTPSRRLLDLSREAALRAEREAIEDALHRFRWNRKRAAHDLGVSYKTLLNKMKECGISQPRGE